MTPQKLTPVLAAAAALSLPILASAAIEDINSIVIDERIFNDFPTSSLTVTDNDLSQVIFDETGYIPDGGGDFANRHAAFFSADNVNPYAFQNNEGFDFSVDITLDTGVPSPAKEIGIYIETLVGGQGQFIGKTGTGEFASFGAFLPFTSSTAADGDGVEYSGATLTEGQTYNFRMIYTPGDGAANTVPATAELFLDGVSAGARELTNIENGVIDGSNIGVYAQFPPDVFASPADFGTATYSNFSITAVGGEEFIAGDYDGNGFVSQADLDLVLLNWGSATVPANWLAADQFDGVQVSQNELDGVLLNWGDGVPPSVSAVPEPTAAALIGLGGLALLRRRSA